MLVDIRIIISLIEIFGAIVYILKYLIRAQQCLKLDTRDVNDLGLAKFRTQAESDTEQIAIIIEIKERLVLILSW